MSAENWTTYIVALLKNNFQRDNYPIHIHLIDRQIVLTTQSEHLPAPGHLLFLYRHDIFPEPSPSVLLVLHAVISHQLDIGKLPDNPPTLQKGCTT